MLATGSRSQRLLALALGLGLGCGVVVSGWSVLARERGPDSVALRQVEFDLTAPAPGAVPHEASEFGEVLFRRRPLSTAELAALQPARDQRNAPDPYAYFVYRPHVDLEFAWPEHPRSAWRQRTNALGFREDGEVAAESPDVRVLVAGDSHTDGVCDNEESFANRLEAELARRDPARSVEVLNAGHGGYSLYHYLGTLERNAWLAPDVFVVAIYGGNDFEESLTLHHLFDGTTRPPGTRAWGDLFARAKGVSVPALAQCFISLKYFECNPGEVDVALQATYGVAAEIQATCLRLGIHPIFVYIPPLADGQPERCGAWVADLRTLLELEPGDLALHDRMADGLLAFLRRRQADVLDMRPEFRAATEDMYWEKDQHISLAAHRRIALALAPLVEAAGMDTRVRAREGGARALTFEERSERFAPGAPRSPDLAAFYDWLVALPTDERAPTLGTLRTFVPSGGAALEVQVHGDERPRANLRVALLCERYDDGPSLGARVARELSQLLAEPPVCIEASARGIGFDSLVAGIEAVLDLGVASVAVVVDGEDDWADLMRTRGLRLSEQASSSSPYLGALARIQRRSAEAGRALHFAVEAVTTIATHCQRAGARLVVVSVPSAFEVATADARERAAGEIEDLGLGDEAFLTASRMSRGFVAALRARELEVLDFAAALERLPRGGCDRGLALDEETRDLLANLIARRLAAAPAVGADGGLEAAPWRDGR